MAALDPITVRVARPQALQRVGAFAEVPELIRELGGGPEPLLVKAGLDPDALRDPESLVPYAAIGELLRLAAHHTRCPHIGLLVGRLWHLSDLGLVGELAVNSRTVADALGTLTVYQHLNSSGGLAFLLTRDGSIDLGYAIYVPGIPGTEYIYDAVLAAGVNYLRELCGPAWQPSSVLIPHAKPVDVTPYQSVFRAQPRFNAEMSALRFPASWMAHSVEGADPERRRTAELRADQVGRGQIVDQVSRALRAVLLHGKNSGDAVAEMLAMHRRTMNRRLKAEGTTFQEVLDTVRFEVARQLLRDSTLALDDVAATLGYAGVTPFMHTFRRWAGTTPHRWRRAAVAERYDERGE